MVLCFPHPPGSLSLQQRGGVSSDGQSHPRYMAILVSTSVSPQVVISTTPSHWEVQQNHSSFSMPPWASVPQGKRWPSRPVVALKLSNLNSPSPEMGSGVRH